MNVVFFSLVMISFIVAGYRQITWAPPPASVAAPPDSALVPPMELMANGMIDAASSAVTLAIGLVGVMSLFLGLMKIAEAGGLLTTIARLLRPLMVRLFPDIPPEHPAMGAMILNMSANVMGLGNAATPFGIRAMQELDKLNPHKGTATDAMVLFLAINTASVTLLPTSVIALRASVGSDDPAGIVPTTLFASVCSTAVAIASAFLYRRFWPVKDASADEPEIEEPDTASEALGGSADPRNMAEADAAMDAGATYPWWVSAMALIGVALLIPITAMFGRSLSPWIIPGLMVGLLAFGVAKRVHVYEAFVEGARDGFSVAVRIIPYLVAILVAVAMLRQSGALDMLIGPLGAITQHFGLPPEALPMALLRPLSGSGAYGLLASVIERYETGPDTYVGYLVSTIQGSSETTFYVLAVYFGAVHIRRIRHALAAGLTADVAGVAGAVFICTLLYSG
ncbi:MAG: nucleoside recognition domain-containing protein [Alphaproteobacteria bacterium]